MRTGPATRLPTSFKTADSDDTARQLAEAGAEIIGGSVPTPWGDRNVGFEVRMRSS